MFDLGGTARVIGSNFEHAVRSWLAETSSMCKKAVNNSALAAYGTVNAWLDAVMDVHFSQDLTHRPGNRIDHLGRSVTFVVSRAWEAMRQRTQAAKIGEFAAAFAHVASQWQLETDFDFWEAVAHMETPIVVNGSQMFCAVSEHPQVLSPLLAAPSSSLCTPCAGDRGRDGCSAVASLAATHLQSSARSGGGVGKAVPVGLQMILVIVWLHWLGQRSGGTSSHSKQRSAADSIDEEKITSFIQEGLCGDTREQTNTYRRKRPPPLLDLGADSEDEQIAVEEQLCWKPPLADRCGAVACWSCTAVCLACVCFAAYVILSVLASDPELYSRNGSAS